MAKQADAADLKSAALDGAYRFEPGSGHQWPRTHWADAVPPEVAAGAIDFGQACAFPQYPSQILWRQARALAVSAIALQSRTRLAMVLDRSLAAGGVARPPVGALGDSRRAMIAATSSASGSRDGVSAVVSVLFLALAPLPGFEATAVRGFVRRGAEAADGADGEAAAVDAAARWAATASAAAAMPGRAARPSFRVSTRAGPSGCEAARADPAALLAGRPGSG